MKITPRMVTIRDNTDYIAPTVHYSRRAADKAFEVVARLTDEAIEALGVSIGGEVVLDVQMDRQAALASVRFFRRQEVFA